MSWLRWRRRTKMGARVAALIVALAGQAFSGTVPAGGPSLSGFRGAGQAFSGAVPEAGLCLLGVVRSPRSVPRLRATEIAVPADPSDDAVLGRPVALAFEGNRLYIVDALDCAVKIFSGDGLFIGSFGRKGQGPGELNFPSGLCAAGGGIAVADKFNFRVQIFECGGGEARGGFKLPFAPDRVVALADGRLLVTANPTGRPTGERLLHIYNVDGTPVWSGLEAKAGPDPVSAAFLNMVLVCPDGSGGFSVIYRSGSRSILRYSSEGVPLSSVAVDELQASVPVVLPTGGGGLRLEGFCWAAAASGDRVYLSAPEALDGQDLGPGRSISVLDAAGRLVSVIELPCAVHRFLVETGRLFAIDDEGRLRIFEVGR